MVSSLFLEEFVNGRTIWSKGTEEFIDRVEVSDDLGSAGEWATWDEDEMGLFLTRGYFGIAKKKKKESSLFLITILQQPSYPNPRLQNFPTPRFTNEVTSGLR